MTATQPQPTELIFKEFNIGKFKTTRNFELINGCITNTPLTEIIRISNNRMFAKSNPDYWLSERDSKKWMTPNLTGLFPTAENEIYFGDTNKKENLILFKFSESHTLKIMFYRGYYPDYNALKQLLKNI